jgi:hypothetical protein
MEFLFQTAIQTATKTLFEENFEKHGWTFKDFTIYMAEYQKAVQDGKIQRWMN